jgi:hypothetical protein
MSTELATQVPINIVGSSTFGVWPKISLEKTYNMYISDGWMISFPGYKKVALASLTGEGRAIFRSVRGGFLIAVIGSFVYRLNSNLAPILVGSIVTSTGEVFIDENLENQIVLVDGLNAYIYSYTNNPPSEAFNVQVLLDENSDVITPGYVSSHNGLFLIAPAIQSLNNQNWYSFEFDSTTSIIINSTQSISTKPDSAIAVRRVPGRGNNVIVLGQSVSEIWTFTGAEPVGGVDRVYTRVSSYNIDNGCISISTIAAGEDTIAWLAVNEANSPVIMVSNGAETKQISTDGIDHLMETIQYPEDSTAFFFRQNGHLFYQLTFFNPVDNLTLIHDFNNNQFFHLSDENLNYHIARDVVYFNEKSYFISLKDASIYEIGDAFNTYSYSTLPDDVGDAIPRIRICKPIRNDDSRTFRCGMFTFWIEQGVNDFFEEEICDGLIISESGIQIVSQSGLNMLAQFGSCTFFANRPAVDMSFSKNGNQSFSNIVRRELNPMAHFRNQIRWHRMGQANEFTIQLRFWGFNRFVVHDGTLEIY